MTDAPTPAPLTAEELDGISMSLEAAWRRDKEKRPDKITEHWEADGINYHYARRLIAAARAQQPSLTPDGRTWQEAYTDLAAKNASLQAELVASQQPSLDLEISQAQQPSPDVQSPQGHAEDDTANRWVALADAPAEWMDGRRLVLAWDDSPTLKMHWETGWKKADGWKNTYGKPFSGEPTHLMLPAPSALRSSPQEGERDDWRPEVVAFANLMERQLRANAHKPGWKSDRADALFVRLREEAEELRWALVSDQTYDTSDRGARLTPEQHRMGRVGREAADVANFAMMIADVCGALSPPRSTQGGRG
ncbi:MAG: hypothetical protein WA840_20560 [Caulobacteraceae bacterium]